MNLSAKRMVDAAILFTYTVVLVWYATLPARELPWQELFWDKLRHVAAFFVMGALTLRLAGFPGLSPRKCARRGGWGILYGLGIGILIEALQAHVPGRTPERADVVADIVGSAAAVLLAVMFLRRRERLKNAAHS